MGSLLHGNKNDSESDVSKRFIPEFIVALTQQDGVSVGVVLHVSDAAATREHEPDDVGGG